MTNLKKAVLGYSKTIAVSLLFAVTLTSCFSPWTGEEKLGSVTVTIGGGNNAGRVAIGWETPPNQTESSDLWHRITLINDETRVSATQNIGIGGGSTTFNTLTDDTYTVLASGWLSTVNDTSAPLTQLKSAGRGSVTVTNGSGNTTVTMVHTDQPVVVTFNHNYGPTPPVEYQYLTFNSNVVKPAVIRGGYTLEGWYKEAAFTNEWNFDDPVSEFIDLYAKWEATGGGTPITNIAILPDPATVVRGGTQQFNVNITFDDGTHSQNRADVNWTVTGGEEADTRIDTDGLLHADAAETATTLTVKASAGGVDSNPVTVTVTGGGTPTGITISPAETTMAKGGTPQQFTATVTYNNGTTSINPTGVTWTLMGGVPGTALNNRELTISAAESATTLAVQASIGSGLPPATAIVTVLPAYPTTGLWKLNTSTNIWQDTTTGGQFNDVFDYFDGFDTSGTFVWVPSMSAGAASPKTLNDDDVTLIFTGNSTTVTLAGAERDPLITVSAGTLILDTVITLKGHEDNTEPLVNIYGPSSRLIMKNGSTITGNTNTTSNGGGVVVTGDGTFIMEGGEISSNHATGYLCVGGGVFVNGGTFTKTGGTMTGNNAAYGNTVYMLDSLGDKWRDGDLVGNEGITTANDVNWDNP